MRLFRFFSLFFDWSSNWCIVSSALVQQCPPVLQDMHRHVANFFHTDAKSIRSLLSILTKGYRLIQSNLQKRQMFELGVQFALVENAFLLLNALLLTSGGEDGKFTPLENLMVEDSSNDGLQPLNTAVEHMVTPSINKGHRVSDYAVHHNMICSVAEFLVCP